MTYVSGQLRQLVIKRAKDRCEYCLFPQSAALLTFEMEHIIAEKHGGKTEAENLALACPYCNRAKGSDLGSIDPETKKLTPFFNPRDQE
jgi:5-methylcytosine-specific restriction endonuclease McrA